MTKLVTNYDRENAEEKAGDLLLHQLHRISDVQQEGLDKVHARDVSGARLAIAKLQSLSAKAHSLIDVWGDFSADLKRGLEAEKAAEPVPAPETPGLPSAADLDAVAAEKKAAAEAGAEF
jgi:hypothetical protein